MLRFRLCTLPLPMGLSVWSSFKWDTCSPAHKAKLTLVQSHIQHYSEPNMNSANNISTSLSTYNGGPLLPLGPGSLTLNHAGIPIVVVCSRADLMDVTGEEAGMKGQWEERTDWIQQVLRTVCLACECDHTSRPHII